MREREKREREKNKKKRDRISIHPLGVLEYDLQH